MQIINNFGPLSNAELLRRYGFVETADNPHDCLELSVDSTLEVGLHMSLSWLRQQPLQVPATSHEERCAPEQSSSCHELEILMKGVLQV